MTPTTETPERCAAVMVALKEAGEGITAKAVRELLKSADPDIRKRQINKILYQGVRAGCINRTEAITGKAPIFAFIG